MSSSTVILSGGGTDGFVELARTKSGRLFRKHILTKGPLIHPETGETIDVNDDFVGKLKANFSNGVCDIVQTPLADDANKHSEAPDRNIGEIIGIEDDPETGKVYAIMDARKMADDVGKTLLGASAMMHLDYTDTKTHKKVGPTLLHMAVTNRPYITNLDGYEELVAATAEETGEPVVLLTPPAAPPTKEKETDMDLAELLAELKDKHNIDVAELQEQASKAGGEDSAKLTAALSEALSGVGLLKLSNGETASADDIVGAVSELASDNVKLSGRIGSLERTNAEQEIDSLVESGHIMPFQRDTMLELRMTNAETFQALVPKEPIVKMSNESGTSDPDQKPAKDIEDAVARYTQMATDNGMIRV